MKFMIIIAVLMLSLNIFAAVNQPQLKWKEKGGGPYLMDGSYTGSPAVADINGDGLPEIIWANRMIYVVDGATGNLIWNVYSGHDRTYQGRESVGNSYAAVVVADIDGNGDLEIVTAHAHGWAAVYDHQGYFHSAAWPKHLCPASEIRGLCAADLNNDGTIELLFGTTRLSENEFDWYVLEPDGSTFPGWPHIARHHCSHGAFNQNIAVANIDNDDELEIIGLADVHYFHAFEHNGDHILAGETHDNEKWADIPVWLDYESELRRWGADGEYLPKFSFSPPTLVDVDNNQTLELVIVSYVHDPTTRPGTPVYHIPMIYNLDHTRYHNENSDWRVFPVPGDLASSKPLSEDWRETKVCLPNPVAADLDGDGFKEIIFPANDGKMHAYFQDKTEHHQWPFRVTDPSEGVIRFATEPIVVDLDADGSPEVIFGSWTPRNSTAYGKLHILNNKGEVVHEITVPASKYGWNGITSAPTIANIDDDPDYELVVGTTWTGICAYDLPGSANAKIFWGTGHGNYLRTGTAAAENANSFVKSPADLPAHFGTFQNYPNPFHGQTSIHLELLIGSAVSIEIFNVLGQKIFTLFQGKLPAGVYSYSFSLRENMDGFSRGIYFGRLTAGNYQKMIKMVCFH